MKYSQSIQAKERLEKLLNQYKEYNQAQNEDEKSGIGDEMTYYDPIVWMMYKHEAYLGTNHEITTVGALKEHCADHGGICAKRFNFLSKTMKNKHNVDITDSNEFPDDMNVKDLYNGEILNNLVEDESFLDSWHEYEFFKKDGKVAKWQNYSK